ncbi:MAG: site-2 protease family protein [Planctomycetota bacterium]
MRLRLGRILKIDIFMHWTFVLVPIVLFYNWRFQMGLDWLTILAMSGLVAVAFICVLMHEYGHALAARHLGIRTRDIIITPIGGLARLERMPRNPFHELYVTIAGPMVNLVLALLVFLLIASLGVNWMPPEEAPIKEQWLPIVMWLNLALFVFNLVPAFPMDGGRILRSMLAFVFPYETATRIAVLVGRLMALVFVVLGTYWQQYSLVFIGCFVFFAASYELRQFRKVTRQEQAVG